MRQGPHNKNRSRSRGRRPTGGGGNQSGRVYESNGPDVKVRGTAQTVADKYLQLARDAHSAGDTVMAEGYFQHAEHYLRILAASQPFPQQGAPQRRTDDYSYDDSDDDDEQPTPAAGATASGGNGEAQRQPRHQSESRHQSEARRQPEHQPEPQQSDGGQGAATPQANDDDAAEQPWGGPEPEFLRREPAPATNGAGRTRRTRQPRSGNGRKEAPANEARSDDAGSAGEDSAQSDTKPDTSGQDTTEQA